MRQDSEIQHSIRNMRRKKSKTVKIANRDLSIIIIIRDSSGANSSADLLTLSV